MPAEDKKISDLDAANPAALGTMLIVQGGDTKKLAATAAGVSVLAAATAAAQRTALGVDAAKVSGGAAATCGIATLVDGTVEVPTTAVAADSVILLTPTIAVVGVVAVGAITAGTKFVITSIGGPADTSNVHWMIAK